MENDHHVSINFMLDGESISVSCIYNKIGEIALVGRDDAIITMSPVDACRLSKMLLSAAEDALADLQEALGGA